MRPLLLLFTFLVALTSLAVAYPPNRDISDTADAQAEAQKRELPIAYLGIEPADLQRASPSPGSQPYLVQMALNELQGRAVVITFDGNNMGPVPALVHAQYHINDDGPLPGGAAWNVPKVVFTDPGITKTLGRVAQTQMLASGPAAIDSLLDQIEKDPDALKPKQPSALDLIQSAAANIDSNPANPNPPFGRVGWAMEVVIDRWPYFLGGATLLILALISWAARNL